MKQTPRLFFHFAFLISICVSAAPLAAQTFAQSQVPSDLPRNQQPLPSPIVPRPQPLPTPQPPTPAPLPPPSELLQPTRPTPTTPLEERPSNVPGTFTVERFEFEGNTAFSDEQLAEVTKQFTGRALTFAELLQARSAVTDLYVRNGYITSGAFIPPQTLTGGAIKIQVVEGRVEEIQVTGTGRLNRNYVRSRIALGSKTPLNVNRLLEALQLLQLNPLIANLSAELSAGSRPGLSVIAVRVTPADTFDAQITLDNGRSPSVGSFRRGVQLTEANLLGQGDSISVSYTNTDGSNEVDVSYTFPVNARNGTLRFSYGFTKSHIIEPPFDAVDIEASSVDYDLTFRQPIIQSPTQELALGLSAVRRESETSLLNTPFPLSPGADDKGRTRITALRFFQEWTQRGSRQVFAARSQFNVGLGLFDATTNNDPPDSRFLAWRGQAQYLQLLGSATREPNSLPLLLLRADVQLADRSLLALEQFGLGGFESVRGYRQDALLTDNGALASAEVRFPIYRLRSVEGVLQVIPFVDLGRAWNSSGKQNPDPSTLASVGLGVQWQQSDRLRARVDYGIPLIEVESGDRTLQERGLYFFLQYNFF
jgi:hemolysin activation/secretion protein